MAEFLAIVYFFIGAAGVLSSFFIFIFMACGIIKPDTIGFIITIMLLLSSAALLITYF